MYISYSKIYVVIVRLNYFFFFFTKRHTSSDCTGITEQVSLNLSVYDKFIIINKRMRQMKGFRKS